MLVAAAFSPVAQRRPALWAGNPSYGVAALNEGRPCWAGNPRVGEVVTAARSTKAGPVGPATLMEARATLLPDLYAQRRPALLGRQPLLVLDHACGAVARSTKAGPVGPATLRQFSKPVGVVLRSTKAGPVGPATPWAGCGSAAATTIAQRRPALLGPATLDNIR